MAKITCPECHRSEETDEAHCILHINAPKLIEALEHARTQIRERNWAERELHEPVEVTIKRINDLIGPEE